MQNHTQKHQWRDFSVRDISVTHSIMQITHGMWCYDKTKKKEKNAHFVPDTRVFLCIIWISAAVVLVKLQYSDPLPEAFQLSRLVQVDESLFFTRELECVRLWGMSAVLHARPVTRDDSRAFVVVSLPGNSSYLGPKDRSGSSIWLPSSCS